MAVSVRSLTPIGASLVRGWARRAGPKSLVPEDDAASRSLIAVVAILTFLAALAAGAVEIVARSSSGWSAAISREATIQIRPRAGRDIEADLTRAAALARTAPGVAAARPLSRADAEELLAPWLGRGLDLGTLPVPRLVVLKLGEGQRADLAALGSRLAAEIPGATLDDHELSLARLSTVAGTIVGLAVAIVVVVLVAAGLAVAFATRGAVAGSRRVVEVLHLVGADEDFIAGEFATRFVALALKGAAAGAAIAALLLWIAGTVWAGWRAGPSGSEVEALLGSAELGWAGYGTIALVAIAVAVVAGLVSAHTVKRFLRDNGAT